MLSVRTPSSSFIHKPLFSGHFRENQRTLFNKALGVRGHFYLEFNLTL